MRISLIIIMTTVTTGFHLTNLGFAAEPFSFPFFSLSSSCFSSFSFQPFLENDKNTSCDHSSLLRRWDTFEFKKQNRGSKKLLFSFAVGYSLWVWSESTIFCCTVEKRTIMNGIFQLAQSTRTNSGNSKRHTKDNLPFIATASGFSIVTWLHCFWDIDTVNAVVSAFPNISAPFE